MHIISDIQEDAASLLEAFVRVRASAPGLDALNCSNLESAILEMGARSGNYKDLDWQDLRQEVMKNLTEFQRRLLREKQEKAEKMGSRPSTAPGGLFITKVSPNASRNATPAAEPTGPSWKKMLSTAAKGKELRMTGLASSVGWVCWGGPFVPSVVAAHVTSCSPGSQILATSSCFGIVRWQGVVADGAVTLGAVPSTETEGPYFSSEVCLHINQTSQSSSRTMKVTAGELGKVALAETI